MKSKSRWEGKQILKAIWQWMCSKKKKRPIQSHPGWPKWGPTVAGQISQKADSETKISVKELYWKVLLALILWGKRRKQRDQRVKLGCNTEARRQAAHLLELTWPFRVVPDWVMGLVVIPLPATSLGQAASGKAVRPRMRCSTISKRFQRGLTAECCEPAAFPAGDGITPSILKGDLGSATQHQLHLSIGHFRAQLDPTLRTKPGKT